MLAIPGSLKDQIIKLELRYPWVILLDFDLGKEHLRLVNNTEPVTYGGNVYQGRAFSPEVRSLSKSARMPSFSLRINNLMSILAGPLRQAGGMEGYTVTAVLVDLRDLTADYSKLTTVYTIRGHEDNEDAVDFEIGGPNLYRFRYPRRRCLATLCEVEFASPAVRAAGRGHLCGYTGADTACAKTLTACRLKNNATRWGGTPGLRPQTMRVVQL